MGVKGLLRAIRSIENHTHISTFSGSTLAIDGYAWLHRGAVTCPRQLALGIPTTLQMDYIMRRVQLLLDNNIRPFFVFDGDYLPSKAGVEKDREESRQRARALGDELWGKGETSQALDQYQKAVDISPTMAASVIQMLKENGLPYVVAPYEADSQMVWLEMHGYVQGIIAEDSDLLVFGAKRLLTKLNAGGDVVEVHRDRFVDCKELNLAGMTTAQLRLMAILAGCDYSDGIGNVGMVKAHKFVRKFVTLQRVLRAIRLDGSYTIPPDFEVISRRADLTFQHQRVWSLKESKLVYLNEPEAAVDEPGFEEFVGKVIDSNLSAGIAAGEIDPIEKTLIDPDQLSLSSVKLVKRPVARTIKSFFTPSTKVAVTPRSGSSMTMSQPSTAMRGKQNTTLPNTPVSIARPSGAVGLSTQNRASTPRGLTTQAQVTRRARKLINNERSVASDLSSDGDNDNAAKSSKFFKRARARKNSNKENVDPLKGFISGNALNTSSNSRVQDSGSEVEPDSSSPPPPPRTPNVNPKLARKQPLISSSASNLKRKRDGGECAFGPGALDKFLFKPNA